MTETDSQKKSEESDPVQESATEREPTADSRTGETGTRETGEPAARVVRRGGFVAWLALLAALASLALASRSYWEPLILDVAEPEDPAAALEARIDRISERLASLASQPEPEDPTVGLRERIDRLSEQVDSLASQPDGLASIRSELETLKARVEETGADSERLDQRVAEISSRLESTAGARQDRLSGLRTRIESLETTVGERLERFEIRLERLGAELEGADAEHGVRLALVEIDSLLAFAQNRLSFGGDVELAERAWAQAVEMIDALPAARFNELAALARRELARIEAYRPRDAQEQVQRLFEMAASVDAWPQRTSGGTSAGASAGNGEAATAGWRDRLASAMDGLVQVENLDAAGPSPIEVARAGARIRITLRTAALALARSERELAETLVSEAAAEIPALFDAGDPAVQSSLSWLRSFEAPGGTSPPRLDETRERIADIVSEPT